MWFYIEQLCVYCSLTTMFNQASGTQERHVMLCIYINLLSPPPQQQCVTTLIPAFLFSCFVLHLNSARLCQARPCPSSSPHQPQCWPFCTPRQWKWQARPLWRSATDSTATPDSAPAALPTQRGTPTLPPAGAQAAVKEGPASALWDPASHHHGTSRHY